jgi:uncharacterized protein (DUF1800 family)
MRPCTLLFAMLAAMPALAREPAPSPDDAAWLNRITFGADAHSLAALARDGQRHYLDQQLAARTDDMPAAIAAELQAMPAAAIPIASVMAQLKDRYKAIDQMPDPDGRQAARQALQREGNEAAQQAQSAEVLRAIYDGNQLREQLVWFWLNHFSVFKDKGRVRWLLSDYADHAIRPHALGRFRDLVLATLRSPAMLEYLDNAQNARGKINENYARELMELHTLGVSAGYTQADVQALATVLTGAGVATQAETPRLRDDLKPYYVRDGAFEFNPNRHDFSDVTLLGQPLAGGGFDEIERAVDLITRQPACATFISAKLARYFVSDTPPPRLVADMARTFRRTDGDIAKVMKTMLTSREFKASLGTRFKDPTQFVVSSVRLAYDGQTIRNPRPLVNWLAQLGQAPFGRITPDGWPLEDTEWTSSGQLAKRFEIAKAMGSGASHLFDEDDGGTRQAGGFPQLATPTYYATVEPTLDEKTRQALAQATSQQEWNAFLLASPEFNHR